jgi:hypothetical protein
MKRTTALSTQLYLTPDDHSRSLSLEEFESADSLEGHHYELIDVGCPPFFGPGEMRVSYKYRL